MPVIDYNNIVIAFLIESDAHLKMLYWDLADMHKHVSHLILLIIDIVLFNFLKTITSL